LIDYVRNLLSQSMGYFRRGERRNSRKGQNAMSLSGEMGDDRRQKA
jgi:hypothetical protein